MKERSLGKLFDAPPDCILAEATNVQPAIVFVDTGRIPIISERGIEGIPSLVVEVLSPSTAQLDRGSKARLEGNEPEALPPFLDLPLHPAPIWA